MDNEIKEYVKAKHAGQVDKSGKDYYEAHLLPLYDFFVRSNPAFRIVALGHDLLEDTSASAKDMFVAGFSVFEIATIEYLTQRKGERYHEYLDRVKRHPAALAVKVADIMQNLTRLSGIEQEEERQRLFYKYYEGLIHLIGKCAFEGALNDLGWLN